VNRNGTILFAFGALLVGAAAKYMLDFRERAKVDPAKVAISTQPSRMEAPSRRDPRNRTPEPEPAQVEDTAASATAKKLDEFEKIMARFFRRNPVAEARASANRAVQEYNQWLKAQRAALDPERGKLEAEFKVLEALGEQIQALDKKLAAGKPDTDSADSVRKYNALARRRNEAVTKYNTLGKAYKAREKAFNEATDKFNAEAKARKQAVERVTGNAERVVKDYRKWIESKSDLAFFQELTRLYGRLRKERRLRASNAVLDRQIERLREYRRELGLRAKRRRREAGNGLIIEPVTLCGAETSFMIVDTGATVVTISPGLVAALGLSERIGKEVEVSLAGGIRIKAPEITIPEVTVLGRTAANVKGVVLEASACGLDGLLGLSFLDRFDYRIERKGDTPLILAPKTGE